MMKQCPFCGSAIAPMTHGPGGVCRVKCFRCGGCGGDRLSEEEALAAWNMRCDETLPSVQAGEDAYEDLRNATPEELLEAVIWFYRQSTAISSAEAEETISFLRQGFDLARPDGWERVAPYWLRKSRRLAALDQ